MEPPSHHLRTTVPATFDVAIVGAGPVGLAIAIELSRLELTTLVVDKRPPLDVDAHARPQLLVARAGDLANLAHLGIDLEDPRIVSLLATRCEADLATGRSVRGDVATVRVARARDLWGLARQPPVALVPIGRLQQALLARALDEGATVRYGCDVGKLRRHTRAISLACSDGYAARATIAIVATGAASPARSLVAVRAVADTPELRMIGAVFELGGELGRWIRQEVPIPGAEPSARCTMLQTPLETAAGTALLVDPQLGGDATDEQLHEAFDAATRAHGLAGVPFRVAPQAFATSVAAVPRRFLAGDGRAPVVIAGDAAQTGHVFTGQTCFVNIALALELCDRLRHARQAIRDVAVMAPPLLHALGRYASSSEIGAAILAQSSRRHYETHSQGAWALAGVAAA